MSERVRKYLPVLKRIRKLGDRARREYVRKCDREFIECVSECAMLSRPLFPKDVMLIKYRSVNLKKLTVRAYRTVLLRTIPTSPSCPQSMCCKNTAKYEIYTSGLERGNNYYISTVG